jgi:SAM-dependent methyltransferase
VRRQYRVVDPLKVRMQTHERYSERRVDLDAACMAALALAGDEAMLAEARALIGDAAPPVALVRGEANALPFRAGVFGRVVARHMLYHVPDIPGALREFARVLAPGGSVLVVTNVEGYLPKINALHDDLLRAFALPLQGQMANSFGRMALSFTRESGKPLLDAAFGRVEEILLTNALMFREPEPIADYIATMFPSWDLPEGSDLPGRMYAWLVAEAGRRLAAEGGVWRDPKAVVLFRCRT